MPLTEQEQRCIDSACRYLENHYGGTWSIQQELDDQYPSEPTPEVILSDGEKTAAVEVKRLTGDSTQQEYLAAILSNDRYFVPSCGGYYYLNPPLGFRLPMPPSLRTLVKREIERVAPTLAPDQSGAIRIPRDGRVALISESGPPSIYCYHMGPFGDLMAQLNGKITGSFMIIDEGLEHSFVTQQCRGEFEEAVALACKKGLDGDGSPFSWDEEWELIKTYHEDDEDGVWMIATTGAKSMQESVDECVHTVLGNAMQKFRDKRWADIQMIVLETSVTIPEGPAAQSVESFNHGDRELIDHFLLLEGDHINEASELVSEQSHAAEAKEQRQHQHVIESPISGTRIQEFKEDYLKSRWDFGATEKIFRNREAYVHRDEQKESVSFGFNTMVFKGPFVDGSNWGDLKGWEFAVAVERRLLTDLDAHFTESVNQTGQVLPDEVARNSDEILNAANIMSDLLSGHGFVGDLIVVATHLDTETYRSLSEALTTPGWELEEDLRTNRILGELSDCLVLYINDPELNSIYVVDLSKFASLVQYDPLVNLNVLPIDEAMAQRIVTERTDNLDLETLLSRVQLLLYQSYEIEVADRQAIWGATLSP